VTLLSKRPRALISLGTNTVRLLVAREAGGTLEQLEHLAEGTRLGEGVRESGRLAPAAVARTLAVVARFRDVALRYDATLAAIATSALRRARDAAAFAERFESLAGVPLQVIDGLTEAAASFAGATYGVPSSERVAVLDVGGGSTECATGCAGRLEAAVSCEIGSVRVSEVFPALTGGEPGPPARAAAEAARIVVREALAPLLELPKAAMLRAVAGTPATLAALETASDVERVRGYRLTRAAVEAWLGRLLDVPLAARRAFPGMIAQRADILPGGALIVSEALGLLGCDAAVVETNDLLLGYLLDSAARYDLSAAPQKGSEAPG
jgi:exopolyphosphatase/guanosine-5'-triphosphate,3'-diphosphate pyrophosphatase